MLVLGENCLRAASQVYEALEQGCPEGLQFFGRSDVAGDDEGDDENDED